MAELAIEENIQAQESTVYELYWLVKFDSLVDY